MGQKSVSVLGSHRVLTVLRKDLFRKLVYKS